MKQRGFIQNGWVMIESHLIRNFAGGTPPWLPVLNGLQPHFAEHFP